MRGPRNGLRGRTGLEFLLQVPFFFLCLVPAARFGGYAILSATAGPAQVLAAVTPFPGLIVPIFAARGVPNKDCNAWNQCVLLR